MVEYINWRRLRGWGKRDESELGIAEQDLRKMEVACGKLADGFGEQAVDGKDVAELEVSEQDG